LVESFTLIPPALQRIQVGRAFHPEQPFMKYPNPDLLALFTKHQGLPPGHYWHRFRFLRISEIDSDEIIQQGYIALWKLCLTYQYEGNETIWGKVAYKVVRAAFWRAIYKHRRHGDRNREIELDMVFAESGEPEYQEDEIEKIRGAMAKLPEDMRALLDRYICQGQTLKEIGHDMGLTFCAIHHRVKKALAKLSFEYGFQPGWEIFVNEKEKLKKRKGEAWDKLRTKKLACPCNLVERFIGECLVDSPGTITPLHTIHAAFVDWNRDAKHLGKYPFSEELAKKFKRIQKRHTIFEGVCLKSEPPAS
jgi:RNA polymerase sigma factor (sigma-70 family)